MSMSDLSVMYRDRVRKSVNRYSAYERYNALYYVEEKEMSLELGKNDVILGFKDGRFERDNIVTFDLGIFHENETESTAIGFLGITGSMKTSSMSYFEEEFVLRHNFCSFEYDAKGEAWIHKQPLTSLPNLPRIDVLMGQLNMKRQGMDKLVCCPEYLGKQANVDRYVAITWQDISDIASFDSGAAVRYLIALLGLNDYDNESIDLLNIAIHRSSVRSFRNLQEFIKKQKGAGKDLLLRKIKRRLQGHVISDNPSLHLDVLNEMKLRQGRGGVVLRGKLKVAGVGNYVDSVLEAMLSIYIDRILNDGLLWNVDKSEKSILRSEAVLKIAELDMLAPDDERNKMSLYLRNILSKSRAAGLVPLLDVQEPSTVDHELWMQVKILNCARVSDSVARLLEKRGMDKEYISLLKTLRMDVPVSFGYRGIERVMINKEGVVKKYVPIMPRSQFMFKRS